MAVPTSRTTDIQAVTEQGEPAGTTEFDDEFKRQRDAIPASVRLVIEKLAYQLSKEGLTIEEACLLKNVDPDWLDRTVETFPIIARIFAQKTLAYRVELFKPINQQAKVDHKIAQWLLDLKTPAKKKGNDEEQDQSMLAMVISHIQEAGDSSPLVRRESGAAVIMTKGTNASNLMRKIKNLLPGNTLT